MVHNSAIRKSNIQKYITNNYGPREKSTEKYEMKVFFLPDH